MARGILEPLSGLRGEWAVVTQSMLASALANVAFRFPETRATSLAAVSHLVARALEPSTRSFDTERWGEDALLSLGSPRATSDTRGTWPG